LSEKELPLKNEKEADSSDNSENDEKICLEIYDKKIIKGFMRGFGKTMILWMIYKEKLHGYEIMNKLNDFYSLDNVHEKIKPPGPSLVYPILHDLEKKGLIKGTWEHQGKRKIKYYEITPEGEATVLKIKYIVENHISKIWENFWSDSPLDNPEKENK
jgi:PadR family transcriptional regulator, regulatory protein PadR